jgi:DNA replication protein DnaC
MHPSSYRLLLEIGLGSKELCDLDAEPIHVITDRSGGFGLIGGNGVGKTWILAHRLCSGIERSVLKSEAPANAKLLPGTVRWFNWPNQAEQLKTWISVHYSQDLQAFLEEASICRVLYLDDLGQERITGENDYALGMLRTIICTRHRNGLPLFWTSNLDMTGLATIYGSRIVSRMLQAWPPMRVKGDDLRLRKGGVA